MRKIDDFRIVRYFHGQRRLSAGEEPPPNVPFVLPQHGRMRLTVDDYSYWVLCFRGADIPHHQIAESELVAQFEAEHGYVLFVAETESVSEKFSGLGIYYLLKDFSGAEYGTMVAWFRTCSAFERFLTMSVPVHSWGQVGPDPLKQVYIEDSDRLVFEVAGLGWFRLTLYEEQPQRYLYSSYSFDHKNSTFRDFRYFCVRHLSGEDRIKYQSRKSLPADSPD